MREQPRESGASGEQPFAPIIADWAGGLPPDESNTSAGAETLDRATTAVGLPGLGAGGLGAGISARPDSAGRGD